MLVRQGLLLSEELIRVSILWTEMWYYGVEEASRLYFSEGKTELALNVLQPLHDLIFSRC